MSGKYPSISPYAYCAWNPLKLVDPNGEDIYEITLTGQINKVRESEIDEFYIIDKNGNRIDGKSLIFSDKIVGGELTLPDKNGGFITYLDIEDGESAKELFEFVSNSCRDNSVEFGWSIVRESEDCSSNLIGFGAQNESHTSANQILVLLGYEINILTHNHPDGLMHPSTSDIDFARNVPPKKKLYHHSTFIE